MIIDMPLGLLHLHSSLSLQRRALHTLHENMRMLSCRRDGRPAARPPSLPPRKLPAHRRGAAARGLRGAQAPATADCSCGAAVAAGCPHDWLTAARPSSLHQAPSKVDVSNAAMQKSNDEASHAAAATTERRQAARDRSALIFSRPRPHPRRALLHRSPATALQTPPDRRPLVVCALQH